MKYITTLFLVIITVAVFCVGCINSSTSFAFKSVIQNPSIEAQGDARYTPTSGDVDITTSNDIPVDVE
jgi:hypothetical protein